jgi:ribose transport system permease protein
VFLKMIDSLKQNFLSVRRAIVRHGEIISFLFFVLLFILAAATSPLFLRPNNLTNIMRQAAALSVVAIGQTFVLLISGIDLSVGNVATVSSIISAVLMSGRNEMVLPAILLSLLAGLLIGLFNGTMITRFKLPDFIVTLAMMSIINGFMFLYTEGREVGMVSPGFMSFGSSTFLKLPVTFLLSLLITCGAYVFLQYTRMGRSIFAVGGNRDSARLSGINVNKVRTMVYGISGVMAALSGLVLLSRMGVGYPLAGAELNMDSIVSVVIGGTALRGGRGNIIGTLFGVLILSILNNYFNLIGVSAFTQIVLKGIIIVSVVILRALGEKSS